MKAGAQHTVKSIFAIAMAAILRVLISSPRLVAGELPLVEQRSRSDHEIHFVAAEIHRALTMVVIGKWVGAPTVASDVTGGATSNDGANRFAPREFPGLINALIAPVTDPPPAGRLVGVVPAPVLMIGAATIMIAWFRRAPAAAT